MFEDPVFIVSTTLGTAVLLRMLKPTVLSAALLAIVLVAASAQLGADHGDQVFTAVQRGRDAVLTWSGRPPAWPPEKNRTYPDLALLDQEGELTRLSEFKGKVILVEPVGIPCQACVAFSGGHRLGAFDGIEPQAGLASIETYAREFGDVRLDDDRIVRVQILLFDRAMQAPTQAEAVLWAAHFRRQRSRNDVVLVGTPELATSASRDLIPGFHLIDKHFMLRADSTGRSPKDDLYTKLLPQIRQLLDED